MKFINKINNFKYNLNQKFLKKYKEQIQITTNTKRVEQNYFTKAKLWADDIYGGLEESRNRYKIAFLSAMVLNVLGLFAIASLAKIQTLVPLIVHHYDNGIVTVEQLDNKNAPVNQVQVESDIVRYITNRESFDLGSYRYQYDLISLLSNNAVGLEYTKEQDKSAKTSPLNVLGAQYRREVHVYSVNFLDNLVFNENEVLKNHQNLAEVVFTLIDTDKSNGRKIEKHYNALISWEYTKVSNSPEIRWKNWDGFLVTRYNKQIRNV